MALRSQRSRPPLLLCLVLCLSVLATACGGSTEATSSIDAEPSTAPSPTARPATPEPTPEATSTSAPTATATNTPEAAPAPDLRAGEAIDWVTCGSGECSTISVPADYDDPASETIEIAVSVHRTSGSEAPWLGYLFVNPGGPGGSGIEFAADAAAGGFTPDVLASFDIIGFDPRGVGMSEPTFSCGDGTEFRELGSQIEGDVDTEAEVAIATEIAGLCGDAMGHVGNRLHSANVARDMDQIRVALDAKQISYYGGSYGSALGVWYATLFPETVRAMVVDGADNPIEEDADDLDTQLANQLEETEGFETQLRLALEACADESCPIYNDGDPAGYLSQAAAKADLVRDASRAGSPMAALMGVITPLYAEGRWPELYDAVFELVENDNAAPMAELAREQLGDVAGVTIAGHVNCLDSWVLQPALAVFDPEDVEDARVLEQALLEELPLIGAFVDEEFDPCPFLGDVVPSPLEQTFNGSDVPILVIGNTSDPATPYIESEELATEVLSNAYLVRVDHPSHVVYVGGFNECVNGHVEAMLIDAAPPSERLVECAREEAPEPTVDDVPPIVLDVCIGYAAEVAPNADPAAVEAACSDAVAPAIEELSAELILSFIDGENEDRIPDLFAIFDNELVEAGLG